MNLSKDGITVEVIHPLDIARYKHAGYVEVKPDPVAEPEKVEEPKPVEAQVKRPAKK